ncbi:AraC-like ligand binding domain-containing protein [Enhydrobacter aerosaccus]|uniref:AraC-like ligand binding domain-containing protein n=1 Tax=Enhydrobacter aerosaccus TaxID=225324 RepID=A0A1T4L0W0_9HYPH|nr:AraC family transcriptional regulator [Enhydrobacter aerosaccus]SJZ48170.1 AraC-like ligand binding domain-containing protein [Enhydrobacter aerosaccus]
MARRHYPRLVARRDPHNVTQYWWDRHLPGLSLLNADFTTHEYPPHTHDALVVAVTEQGGSVIRSRGQVEDAHPSTLFVFNPAEPHAGRMGWSRRWRYRSMYLTQSALDRVAQGLGTQSVPYFTRNLFRDADLIAGFRAIHHALEEGRDVFHEWELLISTFGALFRRHGSGGATITSAPRDRALVARVIERMRDSYATNLSLEELAESVCLTVFQLIGLFKRTVGLTPHAYLTQVRLEMACHLLQQSSSLAEVATTVGFYDQSALNKHFKRCYGITPLQFARAAAA